MTFILIIGGSPIFFAPQRWLAGYGVCVGYRLEQPRGGP
jgi:hypothetical protein